MADACYELLELCLRRQTIPSDLLDRCLSQDDGRAFFTVVVERLGDLFEPALCDVYASLFAEVIHRVAPDLVSRVRRAPTVRTAPANAGRVYVLSRITLGADIAVTSVMLDAVRRRYPDAEIFFVGPRKNFELFECGDILHLPAPYARGGSIEERLDASAALWLEDGLVIDPDSRLSQLGLLRVCPDENYFFFESRSYGGESDARLPDLAAQWTEETFGLAGRPWIAPLSADYNAQITVSLGVGENLAKRGSDEFEADLLNLLARSGRPMLVDLGGTPEEKARVQRALPAGAETHDGPFAPFASAIAKSHLFVGYDSAAGHAASACGVPLVSIATGFVSPRMAARWRPLGTVVSPDHALEAIRLLT